MAPGERLAAEGDEALPARRPGPLIPFVIAAGFFMEGLDGTILGTSLPQIAESLAVSPLQLSLAVTSYLLSLAVFIPISGWLADRFGARRVYCSAILLFTLGSALCGMASSLPMLVAMRVLQGLGGAMMTPVARLILARSFPKDQLINAMNYMAIPGLVGPILGPVVGGFLTTYASWHWIFFINIPIGLIGFVLTLRLIPSLAMPRPAPFDVLGFVIVGLGLALAQLALETVGRDVLTPAGQLGLVAAATAVLALYGRHARRRQDPVLDLGLFRIRSFAVSVLSGSVSRLGIGAVPFLLPLLFQVGFGLDAFHSGLLIFVTTLGAFVMRLSIPPLLRALGLRRVLMGNAALVGLMLAGMALFRADTPRWALLAYLFVFGFARSVQFSSLGALGFADLSAELMGKGSSISAVAQRLSMGAGVAVSAALLAVVTRGRTPVTVPEFAPVFIAVGLVELASIWGFSRLRPEDGAALTGPRRRPARGE